jgi:hypothetical protein
MIVIAGLFIGLLCSAILGAISVVPRFELTFRNLFIFVIGANHQGKVQHVRF